MGSSRTVPPAQISANLARSLEARRRVSRIRAGLADDTLTLEQLLDPDAGDELAEQTRRVEVSRLLRWVAGIGPRTTDRILDDLTIGPSTRVGELTDRRRCAVIAAIRTYRPERSRDAA